MYDNLQSCGRREAKGISLRRVGRGQVGFPFQKSGKKLPHRQEANEKPSDNRDLVFYLINPSIALMGYEALC